MVAAVVPSLYDYIPIFLALAYVVSLLRDWRPIRTLRDENRELRRELEDQGRRHDTQLAEQGARYDALEKKYDELLNKYTELEKSRDFSAALEPVVQAIKQGRTDTHEEHTKMIAALEEVTRNLAAIGRSG